MTYTNVVEESDATNPFRVMRMEARRTQQYLADICDVQEQYIRRLEQGLVNTATEGVIRELLDMLPSSYITLPTVGQRIQYVKEWYTNWQAKRRRDLIELIPEKIPDGLGPRETRIWVMSWLVEDGSEENSQEIIDKCSVYNFCRAFSLHPYTVQRWETVGGEMSPTIKQALHGLLGGK